MDVRRNLENFGKWSMFRSLSKSAVDTEHAPISCLSRPLLSSPGAVQTAGGRAQLGIPLTIGNVLMCRLVFVNIVDCSYTIHKLSVQPVSFFD